MWTGEILEHEDGTRLLVSIVIRVRNAEKDLQHCLETLSNQILPESVVLEFVVVDNASTDRSSQVAMDYSARLVSISREDFTWGRALNRGIAQSRGEFIVLISADVEPLGGDWMSRMLGSILRPEVVAVYGRQIPRANAPIDEAARLNANFPPVEQLIAITLPQRSPNGNLRFLSNACALIRRSAWANVKFDEGSNGAEEQAWMEELIRHGYTYAYEATAMAYHSHRDSYGRTGYRAWELHREMLNRQGKTPAFGNVFYAIAALCKRRLKNVLYVNASMRSRVEGIFSLPFEITAFSTAAVLEGLGADRRAVRNWMWG